MADREDQESFQALEQQDSDVFRVSSVVAGTKNLLVEKAISPEKQQQPGFNTIEASSRDSKTGKVYESLHAPHGSQ